MAGLDDSQFAGTERFQLLRRLGSGGMGVVYEALDRERNARVALKALRTLTADAVLRFKKEFHALQDLQHENLVHFGELISEGGLWFFTMELVDGVDLLDYVRPLLLQRKGSDAQTQRLRDEQTGHGPSLDLARLRAALVQLAAGLHALHAAHKVHRDIKPSNVLVDGAGRVVLLDFGLATDAGATASSFSDIHVVGTADYMAPEQAASKRVGPEADWYSVGVVLYEALTERLPFAGPMLEVLMNKQRFEPQPPSSIQPGVPEDLDRLCADLLKFEPAARPGAREVLSRLGVSDGERRLPVRPVSSFTPAPPFVGRRGELDGLGEAFAASRAHAVTTYVHGESGVGKSALVRYFADGLALRHPEAVVLTGRCYERESVPYKAFDGVIDNLSRWLMRLTTDEVLALLPRKVGLLAQVFPVLRRVEAIAQAPREGGEPHGVDPQELRNRVFLALSELLTRIGEARPLLLVIDDLQWADTDSLAFLGDIMQPPEAPPLLLIATVRTASDRKAWRDSALDVDSFVSGDVRHVHLAPLPPDEARELTARLLSRVQSGEPLSRAVDAIAEEAAGHPLFIDELVRHVTTEAPGASGQVDLEDALWARIGRLDELTRHVLHLVIIAGAPELQEIVARAAAIKLDEFTKVAALLRVANLIRTSGVRGSDHVEPYHDRVRAAVVAHLSDEERRRCHERLALALETATVRELEPLALHWGGAGQSGKAASYAAEAAAQAFEALSFDRAVRLYRLALELMPSGPDVHSWRAQLARALADAGRGGESARAYLAAVEGANAAEALDLQGHAAAEFLRSGHIDEGLDSVGEVLRQLGSALPRTPRRALASLLVRRAQLALRGRAFRERDASQISARDLARLDLHWAVAIGLGLVDNIRGADFQTRHMLLALRTGEPYRVARALAIEACFHASQGVRTGQLVDELLSKGEAMARRLDNPHALGFSIGARGLTSYLQGKFRDGRAFADEGVAILRDRCTGVAWEVNSLVFFSLSACAWLGELDELHRVVPRRLREAEERGNLYAAANLRLGHCNLAWLVRGETDVARRMAQEAMLQWSQQGFHMQHYYDLVAQGQLDLYLGDPAASLKRLSERWAEVASSMLLRIEFLRTNLTELRARSTLALASLTPPSERKPLVASALADMARVERARVPWAKPLCALLRAGVAQLAGDDAHTLILLEEAARGFQALEMGLHLAVARGRRGRLLGGDEGRALVQASEAWLASQHVASPDSFRRMISPGFRD